MKKFIFSISICFSIFLFSTPIQAQDFTVEIKRHILEYYGGLIKPAIIRFDFDDDIFNNHTIHLETLEAPSPSCTGFNGFVTSDFEITTAPEDWCAGKYCFIITKDKGTAFECQVEVCVIIYYCLTYKIKDGKVYLLKRPNCGSAFREAEYGFEEDLSENSLDLEIISEGFDDSNISQEILITDKLSLEKVYPNPFTNILNVDIKALKDEKVNATLYNSLGQAMLSKDYDLSFGSNILELVIENSLPSGSYFFILTDELGNRYYEQVVHDTTAR